VVADDGGELEFRARGDGEEGEGKDEGGRMKDESPERHWDVEDGS
jgi:hypothetical protein